MKLMTFAGHVNIKAEYKFKNRMILVRVTYVTFLIENVC